MRRALVVLAAVAAVICTAVVLVPVVVPALVPVTPDPFTSDPGTAPAWGEAGGDLPPGATVLDDHPGVTGLEPALREALRRATVAAAADGVELRLTAGWRSPAYQARLVREAVLVHGSPAAAARWVADPSTSRHVRGEAVDVEGAAALRWLAAHGSRYGLCPVYDNEPWHHELRPGAARTGCPARYPDPAHDPRLVP